MLIIRMENEILRDPQRIWTDKVRRGDSSFAAVFVEDNNHKKLSFVIAGTKDASMRDVFGISGAIYREIASKCTESPLPHVVINLDKVIADFWLNR